MQYYPFDFTEEERKELIPDTFEPTVERHDNWRILYNKLLETRKQLEDFKKNSSPYGPQMKYVFNQNTLQFAIFKIGSHSDYLSLNPTSAGSLYFFNYQNQYDEKCIGVKCFGESISLGLKSNEKDSSHITTLLKGD